MIDGENTQQGSQQGNGQVAECEPHCIHLVAAERDLLADCHRHRVYLVMCGEVLPVSELPPGLCEPGCDRMVTYCEDCLHDAVRRNADAGLAWSPPGTSFEIDSREGWRAGPDGAGANGVVGHSGAGAVEHPLPGGVVHLISAHEVVPRYRLTPTYIALCGEPVDTSSLPGRDCPNECECEVRGIAYCPGCVREALRWKAELPEAAPVSLARNDDGR